MNEHNILGAILAGGKSKRMGKDKLFLNINDKPIKDCLEKGTEMSSKIIQIIGARLN